MVKIGWGLHKSFRSEIGGKDHAARVVHTRVGEWRVKLTRKGEWWCVKECVGFFNDCASSATPLVCTELGDRVGFLI